MSAFHLQQRCSLSEAQEQRLQQELSETQASLAQTKVRGASRECVDPWSDFTCGEAPPHSKLLQYELARVSICRSCLSASLLIKSNHICKTAQHHVSDTQLSPAVPAGRPAG